MKKGSILALVVCLMATTTVPTVAVADEEQWDQQLGLEAGVDLSVIPEPTADEEQIRSAIGIRAAVDLSVIPEPTADEEQWDQWGQPYGPSYDCETAQGVPDIIVCRDPLLSRMDIEVAILHRDGLEESEGVGEVEGNMLDEQLRWLQARDDECGFDQHSGIGAHYEAVPCLIAYYAERIVELGGGQRVLNVLARTGTFALGDVVLDLGSVRIDLPQSLPVTSSLASLKYRMHPKDEDRSRMMTLRTPNRLSHTGEEAQDLLVTKVGTSVPATPHSVCIKALLGVGTPSSMRRDVCRAGTDHLPRVPPHELHMWEREGYVVHIPWHPKDRSGDAFGYREVGELDDDRTLIHVLEQYTGAGSTGSIAFLAIVRGLRTGETIEVEHIIEHEGVFDYCGNDIDEVAIANSDTLRLVTTISTETLVTLFDTFPEQLHGVTASNRGRLRTLKDSGKLDMAMSIIAYTCIGRAHYDYDIETGRRTLTDVTLEVPEDDDRDITMAVLYPMQGCLFDFIQERHTTMPIKYRPTELPALLADFIDSCAIPQE